MNAELQRLRRLQERISDACQRSGRDPGRVRLLAVSKKQPADLVRRFFEIGQTAFGENRVQEALAKQAELDDLDIEWHFIGPIQSNKARDLAEHFDWVQSVDRMKVLEHLARYRPGSLPVLKICLQVNIDREAQKSGLDPDEVLSIAERAREMPRVSLQGLMAIPRYTENAEEARDSFRRMRILYQALIEAGHDLDTLSMGMSGDLELAIEEGSTMIRVGTDLMGRRAT